MDKITTYIVFVNQKAGEESKERNILHCISYRIFMTFCEVNAIKDEKHVLMVSCQNATLTEVSIV